MATYEGPVRAAMVEAGTVNALASCLPHSDGSNRSEIQWVPIMCVLLIWHDISHTSAKVRFLSSNVSASSWRGSPWHGWCSSSGFA